MINKWNGSKWVDAVVRKWNGSKMVDAVVKRWNGSAWVVISEKEYVETWTATWSASYYGAGNMNVTTRVAKWGDTVSHYAMWFKSTSAQIVSWNNLKSPHRIWEKTTYIVAKQPYGSRRNTSGWMYQGRYSPKTHEGDMGRQRSMIGFNHTSLQSYLKGAKIEKIELYLKNSNSAQSKINANIGYHNNTAMPASFGHTKYNAKQEQFNKGQGKWVTLPREFGDYLRDGKAKGVTLFADTDSLAHHGYFHGKGAGSEPQLRITYRK